MKKRHPHKSNVLLVNITRLGDMLQATPTIAGIKQENPDAKVTVLVEKQFADVCTIIPNIDKIIGLDLGMTVRSLSRERDGIIDSFEYISGVVDDLRTYDFDYCLNMSSSAYTALLLKLVGIERNGGWRSDEEGFRVIESDWAKLFASSVFHQNRQFNSLNLVDVFRCSADVEKHPNNLLINVDSEAKRYAEELLSSANFTNTGPIVAIQAGASQGKRQWAPIKFIKLIDELTEKHNARVVLVGSSKEMAIIQPIKDGCVSKSNVFVAGGRTTIPQLTALLSISNLLVTGDTGPMHISVAVGTPVVALFLASAYGFETGPYSPGNIVLQPVIGCGPCNPNKGCARPDCHDTIDPRLVADLVALRLKGDVRELPHGLVDPNKLIVYRSEFDENGFCDLRPLSSSVNDRWFRHRDAYRKMWLDDIGGFQQPSVPSSSGLLSKRASDLEGLTEVVAAADRGLVVINELIRLIKDTSAPGRLLGAANDELSQIDRKIEELGYHFQSFGPVTRMFMFAKENISGADAVVLASQMKDVYADLRRRSEKLGSYFQLG
jgi:ADP-heptose:LPS heptosyltransferase